MRLDSAAGSGTGLHPKGTRRMPPSEQLSNVAAGPEGTHPRLSISLHAVALPSFHPALCTLRMDGYQNNDRINSAVACLR